MYYIQRKDKRTITTLAECEDYREAVAITIEYRLKNPGPAYYISQRPCKAWRDKCTSQ